MPAIAAACADQLFTDARTHNTWAPEPLSAETLKAIYELARWAPTSANCNPGRFVFVQSDAAKARLIPHLSAQNQAKSQAAAACVIVAHDMAFTDHLLALFPQAPGAASWFADPAVKQETAFRNGTLQGAYFIMAARALGLDCGPMSGFDKAGVDAEFFAGTSWKSNFLINIGHGKAEDLFPRNPRLSFEDACRVL